MFSISCSHDRLGMRTESVTQKILSQYDFGHHYTKAKRPVPLFRQAVLKIKSLMILVKSSKIKMKDTYISNPLLYQYFYLLTVFLYVNWLVFFWISAHGNPNFDSETGLSKFICGKSELPINLVDNIKKCRSYLNNPLAQLFYGLNMLYIFFSLKQIRAGRALINTRIMNFENIGQKIKFYCYLYIPLIREFTAILEFCVQRTCLNFTDCMMLNDLDVYMHLAKIKKMSEKAYKTGRQLSRNVRLGIMIGVVNLLILALVFPLFLFSNSNTTSSFDILTGSMVVQLVDKQNQKISTLFKTDKMRGNRLFDYSTPNSTEMEDINRLWSTYSNLNRFSDFQFHKVTMMKYSDTFLDFTPQILNDLSDYFRQGAQAKILFNLTFTV